MTDPLDRLAFEIEAGRVIVALISRSALVQGKFHASLTPRGSGVLQSGYGATPGEALSQALSNAQPSIPQAKKHMAPAKSSALDDLLG